MHMAATLVSGWPAKWHNSDSDFVWHDCQATMCCIPGPWLIEWIPSVLQDGYLCTQFTTIVMYMRDIKEIINQLLMSDVRRFTVDIHHEDLVSHCHSCCFCYCCQCGSSFLQADAWSRRAISSSWCMPWWTCLYLSSRRVSSNDYFSHKKLNFSIY